MLLIPLAMIQGQIESRSKRKQSVVDDVAASTAGRQQLIGPLLIIPYTEWQEQKVYDETTKSTHMTQVPVEHHQIINPTHLEMGGEVKVEERHRGLYTTQIYHLETRLKARFTVPTVLHANSQRVKTTFPENPFVLLGLSDLRGVGNRPSVVWDGKEVMFTAKAPTRTLPGGVQAHLGPVEALRGQDLVFEIPLQLMGSQVLSLAPVADDNRISLKSNWPTPSFTGRFLPVSHRIDGQGFEAQWQVSSLARSLESILEPSGKSFTEEALSIAFIEPVNIYLQSERAVKYGFLFVGLTFAGFFFFEMLKRMPIHPMQYLLVGFALAIFFLLLLSLTEHITFPVAYLIASSASVVLLGAYLMHVLQSRWQGMAFTAGFAALFGVLYALLASEDNALLTGSLLLFAVLAIVMMSTRKLDWYALSNRHQNSTM
ncbi:MAG: cell envelope integrity protein CreD [Firmicutes bacterium]|nr:cell envelope integrity protein CreD [Bacillota bacterium]